MNLNQVTIEIVNKSQEPLFNELMNQHHYLGSLNKIGETIWYVAVYENKWVALLSFSSGALHCSARDQWIGWKYRNQYDRLHLLINNTRFLILPDYHVKNLASKILSICKKRLSIDWQQAYSHPILMLETFVDGTKFSGTIYKASNWQHVGMTKGFRKTSKYYTEKVHQPKQIFMQPLTKNARTIMSANILKNDYQHGKPNTKLTIDQMKMLPAFFKNISDPRRTQGRRHRLVTVIAIAVAATLCGMKGYRSMADWANSLGQSARRKFFCYKKDGKLVVPSEFVIRDVLVRINPQELDAAFGEWNKIYGIEDESLAIDGKTMCNAIDKDGYQTHIMSVIGHESNNCHTQKKLE